LGTWLQVLDDSKKWWKARNWKGQVAHVPHTIVSPLSEYPQVRRHFKCILFLTLGPWAHFIWAHNFPLSFIKYPFFLCFVSHGQLTTRSLENFLYGREKFYTRIRKLLILFLVYREMYKSLDKHITKALKTHPLNCYCIFWVLRRVTVFFLSILGLPCKWERKIR